MARRTTRPADEVEELEVEDDTEDLEVEDGDEVDEFDELEVDEDEEAFPEEAEEEAPKPRSRAKSTKTPRKATTAKSSSAPVFGTKELVAHVNKMAGTDHDGRALRIILRALSNEGVIERNVGSDRERYSFTGPNDPQVKAVVAEVKRRKNAPKAAPVKKAAAPAKPAAKTTTTRKTPAKTTAAKPTPQRRTRATK